MTGSPDGIGGLAIQLRLALAGIESGSRRLQVLLDDGVLGELLGEGFRLFDRLLDPAALHQGIEFLAPRLVDLLTAGLFARFAGPLEVIFQNRFFGKDGSQFLSLGDCPIELALAHQGIEFLVAAAESRLARALSLGCARAFQGLGCARLRREIGVELLSFSDGLVELSIRQQGFEVL